MPSFWSQDILRRQGVRLEVIGAEPGFCSGNVTRRSKRKLACLLFLGMGVLAIKHEVISLSEPADWVTPGSIKQPRHTDAALSSCAFAVIVNPSCLSVCLSAGNQCLNEAQYGYADNAVNAVQRHWWLNEWLSWLLCSDRPVDRHLRVCVCVFWKGWVKLSFVTLSAPGLIDWTQPHDRN